MTTPRTSPSSFDPITLEVIRHRLDTVAEEMETVLLKSSCSPIVKEGLDASASLFTLDGSTLAQACAIPIHLGTLIPAVAAIIAEFPVATMRKGDVYIMNDPYCGGTHLPDFAVVMPVFSSGQPVALAATMTHHQDVGGKTAGSVPTDSTEIYQEGLRIPPVQWAREGVFDQTLTKVLRLNVRIPDIFLGDLHAQIAACKIAAVRLDEMTARHGHNELLAAFGLLLDQSEALTRDALARLPKGTYRFVDWLDNDGIDIDRRIRIEVAATIAGGEIHFDLTGTDAQVRGPVNCVPSGSLAAACFAVRAVTDPTIPNNAGCFRPIRLTLPEGSLVNPTEPAGRRTFPGRAGPGAGGQFRRTGRDGLRRPMEWATALRHRRPARRRLGRQRRSGRGRRHRVRCHQLHERSRRGDGDGGTDPGEPLCAAPRHRRRRGRARRAGAGEGIRDPALGHRRGLVLAPRRAAFRGPAGRGRRL
jgi:N-methylhydantoinase B/oxoprolinase/acetone carboxylase alpha subunit